MSIISQETLAPEQMIALAHTPARLRERLAAFFALDRRLGRIVAATTEPMLGQMRLAWWREMFAKPHEDRPQGDAVLETIGEHWGSAEDSLIRLVDGWEHLIGEGPLARTDATAFAFGRQLALCAVFEDACDAAALRASSKLWALADLAANVSDDGERRTLLALARELDSETIRLPREAKGVVVLRALAKRSVKNGGRPLMEGRGASITAMKAAILRR